MSLFPGIKVDGHGYKEGLDPNGGSLQSVIEKNIFVEADRGQPFRKKLAAVLARVRTPIPMPRLHRFDREKYYPLSVAVKDVDLEFITERPVANVPRNVDLRRNEVYQEMEGRADPFPMEKARPQDVPEDFLRPQPR